MSDKRVEFLEELETLLKKFDANIGIDLESDAHEIIGASVTIGIPGYSELIFDATHVYHEEVQDQILFLESWSI